MPTNPMNPLQEFTPNDVLRVQVDTSLLPNQFLNPIGEYGIWGWDTAGISNTALQWNAISNVAATFVTTAGGGTILRLLVTGSAPSWIVAGGRIWLSTSDSSATRYYTVNAVAPSGVSPGDTNVDLDIPADLQPNTGFFWASLAYTIYQFVNTTSDVPAYLMFNAAFFETTVSQAAYMLTKLMPIQAGQWAGGSLNTLAITASHTLRFSFQWLDEDGVLLSTSTTTGALSGVGAHYLDARQAPANTAFMRLKVQMHNGTGTSNPAAGARLWFSETVVTKASTSGALQTTRTNLFTNPSFETNTTGWTINGAGTISRPAGGVFGGSCLQLTTTVGSTLIWGAADGPTINVTAGKTYTLSSYLKRSASTYQVKSASLYGRWNTSSSGQTDFSIPISASTPANTWERVSTTFTVPAGVTSIQLKGYVGTGRTADGDVAGDYMQVDGLLLEEGDVLKSYFDGSFTDTATLNYSWTGTAHGSTSTLVSPTYEYVNPEQNYSDVLGRSSAININREELDVGTLNISAKDVSLDPSKATLIRPGRKVRAQVLIDGAWNSMYEGLISNAKVNYDLLDRDPNKRSIVSITASNGIQVLANSRQPNGVAILDDLGPALYSVNLPAIVNGLIATDEYASANPVTYVNENASVLDVIAIARDSESGYAWVSRDNVLNAWSADQISTVVAQTFDEDDYNPTFNIDYDTDRCINSVSIKALRTTGSGETQQTEEWTFGPYRDNNSIGEWGTYSAEFTVSVPVGAVLNTAYFQPFANAVLAANATPRLRVNSLTFAVKDEASLARTLIELYDLIEVTNTEAGITAEQMRVTGINHVITPSSWLVTLTFAHEGSVATPQITPPLSSSGMGEWQEFTKVSPSASMANIVLEYRISGSLIEWRTSGNTAADFSVPTSGDASNQNITTSVPENMRPEASNWTWVVSIGRAVFLAVTPGGNVTLFAADGNGTAYTITSGTALAGQSPAFLLP